MDQDFYRFRDLLRDLWSARFLMLFFGFVFLVLAGGWCFSTKPYHRASMLVSPTWITLDSSANIEGIPRFFNQDREIDDFSFLLFEHTVTGIRTASTLIHYPDIIEHIKEDRLPFWPEDKEIWSAERLAEYLNQKIKIEPISDTRLRRISYNHPDPVFAKKLLKTLHSIGDEIIRNDIRLQTDDFIAHLEKELKQVRHPDHRKILTFILMEQEQIKILTSLEKPYAALIAEPPVSSVRPIWPKAELILPIGLFIGLLIGFFVFNIRRTLK